MEYLGNKVIGIIKQIKRQESTWVPAVLLLDFVVKDFSLKLLVTVIFCCESELLSTVCYILISFLQFYRHKALRRPEVLRVGLLIIKRRIFSVPHTSTLFRARVIAV